MATTSAHDELFRLNPERLTRPSESYLFEEWREEETEVQDHVTRGYVLDLVENPVLHFCLPATTGVRKFYLDSTSIFEDPYPKVLDLEKRKWIAGNYDLWSQLKTFGYTCNIYSQVVHAPWHQVNRRILPLLKEGYLCKLEFVSPRAHHPDDDQGNLLRQVMDTVRKLKGQEEANPSVDAQLPNLYALAERRVRAGCYQYIRG